MKEILEADSIDYEELLSKLRSDVIIVKDIVMTAIRRMVADIEQHGSHDLCELIATSSRLSTTLPNETQTCIGDALLDLITKGQTKYAIDFLNELRLSNPQECSIALNELATRNMDNEDIKSTIDILKKRSIHHI